MPWVHVFVSGLCLNDYGTGSLRHSLQDRLSKAGSSGKGRSDEINVKLCTSTGWFVPLLVCCSYSFFMKRVNVVLS